MSSIPQTASGRKVTGPPGLAITTDSQVTLAPFGPLNSCPTIDFRPSTTVSLDSSTISSQDEEDGYKDLDKVEANGKTGEPENTLQAWLQVFASFLLLVNGYGYYSSFGAFQSHWQTTLQRSPADISWTGSLQLSLPLVGAVAGRLMDQGHFRSLMVTGCLLQLIGIFVTSFVTRPGQYAQLLIAQGFIQGLGNGILFTPCVTLISLYFVRYRAFALGVSSCGAPIGGVIFTMVRCLQK